MKKVTKGILVAAAVLATPMAAQADVALGAGVGFSSISKYDDVDNGTSYRLAAAYRFDTVPIFLEAQYWDGGDMKIKGSDFKDISFDGWTAGVGYRLPLDQVSGSDVYFKGGYFDHDVKIEAEGGFGSAKDSGNGAFIGFGGTWMFSKNVGLNADLQLLFGVEDFAKDEDLTLATIGILFAI